MPSPLDTFGRPLRSLRLSVTDRCNLRCAYCMPEEEYRWLASPSILTFEEAGRVVDAFVRVGVRKLRLTGGEPLVRRELHHLVALLAQKPLDELALTTNGVLLAAQAAQLKAAGLQRLTVSLDTLRPDRFKALTRRDSHGAVLEGLAEARRVGFGPGLKLDTVVMKGVNDDEVLELLAFAGELGAELRFIEYMDVGGATRWSPEKVVSRAALLEHVSRQLGPVRALPRDAAPAERFELPSGQRFGIIASTTQPFCGTCDRARLTADGALLTCLYAKDGLDVKALVRQGLSVDALAERLIQVWAGRVDRGAEARLELAQARGPAWPRDRLTEDPHLEMHTRGG